jgi:two-component system KDP operon response regulator KdpE
MPTISDLPLKILVVDDERPIRRFLNACLGNDYMILEAENGSDAIRIAAVAHPDVILLDLGLPDMDGTEVTRRIREWTEVPIIMISVRDGEQDKIGALDAGADDFLAKPFGTGELLARIRAALRRFNRAEMKMAAFQEDDLMVDLANRQVRVEDRPVKLTPIEYRILRVLVNHAGKVLTHEQLIRAVWGGNDEANSHLLRVNISNLRRKIEHDPLRPQHILTEPGVGYRLREMQGSL